MVWASAGKGPVGRCGFGLWWDRGGGLDCKAGEVSERGGEEEKGSEGGKEGGVSREVIVGRVIREQSLAGMESGVLRSKCIQNLQAWQW